ncbi:MRP protein homolog [Prochlorococcus marinus subsp. pastoris str. CCMP1986]|uniref:Iron-sulfur cluster carrier protein n=1 Tax=Prochlorococcus marinus subsp. pastoris (strain CCMP1986 / NIES-2087 / MED4) TaxID=59919 RepID=Q7UZS4_PROMP|nr:Mrp/NBP35 family ATP-binding protein [Prochlorococcus marinus]KGF86830.1 Scaffold protein for 4Fe-4S cluster assembly [Prochlorococcus marinus str. EQPAC1]CAE20040.1 MRP protein homolog [Prochlorococcus marinus subsp. pastoris str. CCMP1986]
MTTVEDANYSLSKILDSGSKKNLIELAWIKNVRVILPRIIITLSLPSFANSQRERIVKEVKNILLKFEDVNDVQIEIDNKVSQSNSTSENNFPELKNIKGIKHIIAISSGKGGVGKSTIAVNIACSLAKLGLKTGLLDADIYGPNTPSMLGVTEENPKVTDGSGNDQRLIPINKYGISLVSMGFLIEEGQPVIWRGPMLNSIIKQFLYQVEWNNLDFLVIDLPPGTGDAQISLSQSVPISGAIVVTTPQKVSLQDARRGLAMFKQLGVPLLGVVENMSVFIPPDMPNKKYEIFGKGGGKILAGENNLPLLAQIPIEIELVNDSNKGVPISISEPDKESSIRFKELAQLIKKQFIN